MCTGLVVGSVEGALLAHSTFAGAHAGRRKIIIAVGGQRTHHTRMVSHGLSPVNVSPTTPRVAFQGAPGAFGEHAIALYWPNGAQSVPCLSFDTTIASLMRGDVNYAVLPVENVIAGPVHAALHALSLAEPRVKVKGEVTVPIGLCCMALAGATIDALRVVRSHDVALAQCGNFFTRQPHIVRESHEDTAGAARDVAAGDDRAIGAIAGEAAAARYGLVILAHAIQDVADNWTRFVILARST